MNIDTLRSESEDLSMEDLRLLAMQGLGIPTTPEEKDAIRQQILLNAAGANPAHDNLLDNMSAEEIQAAFYKASQSVEHQEREYQAANAANQFVAATPGYVANSKNGYLMQRELEADGLPITIENLNAAWDKLSRLQLVDVNQAEIDAEQKQVHKLVRQERATRMARRLLAPDQPSEDPRTMDVDELRRRALESFDDNQ